MTQGSKNLRNVGSHSNSYYATPLNNCMRATPNCDAQKLVVKQSYSYLLFVTENEAPSVTLAHHTIELLSVRVHCESETM